MNSTSAINSQTSKLCHSDQGKKSNKLSLLPTGSTTVYQILNPEEITRSNRNMRSLASDQQVSCFY